MVESVEDRHIREKIEYNTKFKFDNLEKRILDLERLVSDLVKAMGMQIKP